MTKAIDTVLGKNTTEYRETYAPDYLVAIDRQDNRTYLNIDSANPPFTGFDIWHCYEASFLVKGFPVNGLLKIKIPATSPFTVESKSLKLYLFSYIMEEMGDTEERGIHNYETRIRKDLSALCHAPVEVSLHTAHMRSLIPPHSDFTGMQQGYNSFNVDDSKMNMLRQRVAAGTALPTYSEDHTLLRTTSSTGASLMYSRALKSNCKVTHQPDWGTVYVYTEGSERLTPESFLEYVVSFRNENHFHEEIVECMFRHILDKLQPDVLDVMAFYTRRGGIDICPMRSTRDNSIFTRFADMSISDYREFRS